MTLSAPASRTIHVPPEIRAFSVLADGRSSRIAPDRMKAHVGRERRTVNS